VLGQMLFQRRPAAHRSAARGLMWLTLARDSAPPTRPGSGKLQPGDFTKRPKTTGHGAADARALGPGRNGLIPAGRLICRPSFGGSRHFEIDIGPDRHMVRGFSTRAHNYHADIGQPVAGLRRQAADVDSQAQFFCQAPAW